MATASKKKSVDDIYELRDDDGNWNPWQICNAAGIKSSSLWKLPNRYDFTYFLLPRRAIVNAETPCNFDYKEFVGFWHQLDDNHKERRLLTNFMCTLRMAQEKAVGKDGAEAVDGVGVSSKNAKSIVVESVLASDLASTFRRLFIENQRKRDRRGKNDGFNSVVEIFVKAHVDAENKTAATVQCYRQYFEQVVIGVKKLSVITKSSSTIVGSVDPASAHLFVVGHWKITFVTFLQWFSVWQSLGEKGKRRYLEKLRVAVPHWRQEDRDLLSNALETKGQSCRGTYVERLLKSVGPKRFKVIVFGEEKFCGGCSSSSYGKRLFSCQRCVDERVRPKARYCNVECQKADWLNHKAKAHSGDKKKEE